MNEITVNGNRRSLEMDSDWNCKTAIEFIYDQLNTKSQLVSEVKVNGRDWSQLETRQELSTVSVVELQEIEVSTVQPNQMANETIEQLGEFLSHLCGLSIEIAEEKDPAEFIQGFIRLVDGLSTVNETIQTIKSFYRIGPTPRIDILEADLLSILNDIQEYHEKTEPESQAFLRDLLRRYLPQNLRAWRKEGIESFKLSLNPGVVANPVAP